MNTGTATGAERPFRIYRSSAGSGKTYTLAREYLALALRSPDQFGQILAVTFTNKATREMKDRILRFLEELRDGRSPELAAHFSRLLGLDPAALRQRAAQLLGNILHRYDEFAVSTIDAFFQRIVRAFARELGLLGNFAVELDEEKVRHLVVELTLASAGSDPKLTEWLAEYVDRNLEESRNWDVRKEVGELAREVFGERFKRLEDEVLQHPRGENAIPDFRRELLGAKAAYEKQVKALAGPGSDLIRSSGLEISDFKQGIRGPAAYFDKAIDKPGDLPNTYTRKALADPAEWASRSSPQRARILQLVDGGLMDRLHRLVDFQERHARRYNSLSAALAEIYTFGILTDFVKKIAQYRDEEDVMLISDVNQFLLKIIRDSPAPFVYEKTGTRFRHFLIDEFQDTSGFQWECLLPLVLNSLAEYHTNLVVGDVKQSIYRWRDGDWNLLARRLEEDIRPDYTHTESLNINWRSSGRIVQFNNQLFRPDALPGLLAARYRQVAAEAGEDAGEFERLYADAVQQMPAGMPERLGHGCVRIGFSVQNGKAEEWQARVLELLPSRIQQLLALGYRSSDIAVLVRRKSEGAEVVKRLIAFRNEEEYRSGLPYEVVSNESLLLGNAPVVRLLIHALESLHRPDDRLALLSLAASACEIAGERDGGLPAVLKADPANPLDAWIPEAFHTGRDELRSQALPHLIEALIRLFGLTEDSAHLPWLQAFQEAVLAFTDDHPQDLGQLLEWWSEEGSSRALQIPGDLEALQVMTIHKAKGLEFKVVLLPFCRWSLNHSAGAAPVLWCSSGEPPFDRMPLFPVRYSGKLAETLFSAEYLREYGRVLVDNLNLLYVAFTRARELLWVDAVMPAQKKIDDGELKTVSDALYAALARFRDPGEEAAGVLTDLPEAEGRIFQYGEMPEARKSPQQEAPGMTPGPYQSTPWSPRIRIRRRGLAPAGPGETDAPAPRRFGLLVHELLSEIRHKGEVPRSLAAMLREGKVGPAEYDAMEVAVARIMALPGMDEWFAPDSEVWTEAPILRPGDQALRPDRVVRRQGLVSVIDFKTGIPLETHRQQVALYRDLLARMMPEPVKAFLVYTQTATVVEVP